MRGDRKEPTGKSNQWIYRQNQGLSPTQKDFYPNSTLASLPPDKM